MYYNTTLRVQRYARGLWQWFHKLYVARTVLHVMFWGKVLLARECLLRIESGKGMRFDSTWNLTLTDWPLIFFIHSRAVGVLQYPKNYQGDEKGVKVSKTCLYITLQEPMSSRYPLNP